MAVAKETLNQPRTAQASACYCHCCQPARASGEEVKAMARQIVHGDRVCRVCKGLVVDGYRIRCGTRRPYFDSIGCLNRYVQTHPKYQFYATEAVTVIARAQAGA